MSLTNVNAWLKPVVCNARRANKKVVEQKNLLINKVDWLNKETGCYTDKRFRSAENQTRGLAKRLDTTY